MLRDLNQPKQLDAPTCTRQAGTFFSISSDEALQSLSVPVIQVVAVFFSEYFSVSQ